MGGPGDEWAVVDESGAVKGVERLRVVDASIMPEVPSTVTNATTIMIAEHRPPRVPGLTRRRVYRAGRGVGNPDVVELTPVTASIRHPGEFVEQDGGGLVAERGPMATGPGHGRPWPGSVELFHHGLELPHQSGQGASVELVDDPLTGTRQMNGVGGLKTLQPLRGQ